MLINKVCGFEHSAHAHTDMKNSKGKGAQLWIFKN